MSKIDLSHTLAGVTADVATAACLRTSHGNELVGTLSAFANERPYVVISRSDDVGSGREYRDRSCEILRILKGQNFQMFELIAAYVPTRASVTAASVKWEVMHLIFKPQVMSLRAFIRNIIAITETEKIDDFLLGLPAAYNYATDPVGIDGLSPGEHYVVSPDKGPKFRDTNFNAELLARYRTELLTRNGKSVAHWQWIYVTAPNSFMGALLLEALGLRWNTNAYNDNK